MIDVVNLLTSWTCNWQLMQCGRFVSHINWCLAPQVCLAQVQLEGVGTVNQTVHPSRVCILVAINRHLGDHCWILSGQILRSVKRADCKMASLKTAARGENYVTSVSCGFAQTTSAVSIMQMKGALQIVDLLIYKLNELLASVCRY